MSLGPAVQIGEIMFDRQNICRRRPSPRAASAPQSPRMWFDLLHSSLPRDLPVEEPSRFTSSIDMRTAAALGLNVPGSVLMRADEVIE